MTPHVDSSSRASNTSTSFVYCARSGSCVSGVENKTWLTGSEHVLWWRHNGQQEAINSKRVSINDFFQNAVVEYLKDWLCLSIFDWANLLQVRACVRAWWRGGDTDRQTSTILMDSSECSIRFCVRPYPNATTHVDSVTRVCTAVGRQPLLSVSPFVAMHAPCVWSCHQVCVQVCHLSERKLVGQQPNLALGCVLHGIHPRSQFVGIDTTHNLGAYRR